MILLWLGDLAAATDKAVLRNFDFRAENGPFYDLFRAVEPSKFR